MNWFAKLFRRRRVRIDSAALSDRGLVRAENQDHVLVNRGRRFYCVADGMGGGDGGAKASEIVCRCLRAAVARRTDFAERLDRVRAALAQANADIRAYAARAGFTRQMASTAALLALDPGTCRQAVVGFIGDSRVYRLRDGGLVQLTRDHTIVRELNLQTAGRAVAAGLRDRSLAISHMLTRALGVQEEAVPEWGRIDVRRDDVFLVCSDGLYDAASEADIRGALAAGGAAKEIAARLARLAVAGGAGDNYSLVVVKIGGRR